MHCVWTDPNTGKVRVTIFVDGLSEEQKYATLEKLGVTEKDVQWDGVIPPDPIPETRLTLEDRVLALELKTAKP